MQILWVNLVTDVTLGLALAFEPAEPDVMRRPPRPARRAAAVALPALARGAGLGPVRRDARSASSSHALRAAATLETARTLVVNTLVVMQIFYLFNVRYLQQASFSRRGALGTPAVLWALAAVVAAQLAFTYAPFMQAWFDTRPVALADGALVLACGIAFMVLLEAEKLLLRRWRLLARADTHRAEQRSMRCSSDRLTGRALVLSAYSSAARLSSSTAWAIESDSTLRRAAPRRLARRGAT